MNLSTTTAVSPAAEFPHGLTGRAWLMAAMVIPLLYFAASLHYPPIVNSDSAIGFLTWDSMRAGAHWNNLSTPAPADIARDSESFVTWWSPGQYVLCAPWQFFGLSLGQAVSLTTLLSAWLGLAGYVRLFHRLGFAPGTIALGVFFIATGWGVAQMFSMYWGGDIVLFGFIPWLMLMVIRAHGSRAAWLLLFPPLFLFGTFLKLTFPIVALGLLLFCFTARHGWVLRFDRTRLLDAAIAGIALTVFYGILYWTFLRHGKTGASQHTEIGSFNIAASFALSGCFFSAFSLGTLIDRIVLFPSAPLLAHFEDLGPWLWPFAPLALWTYFLAWRHAPAPLYRNLLLSLIIAFVVVFTYFYWSGSNVGFSDRYYRPAGFLLLPGLLCAWREGSRVTRIFLGLLLMFSLIYGLGSFIMRTHYRARHLNTGLRGFTQSNITPAALRALDWLDAHLPAGNNLIYVPSVEIALDLVHQRRFAMQGLLESRQSLERRQYHGRPDRMIILVPDNYATDGRTEAILRSFVDIPIDRWKSQAVGGWLFYFDDPALQPLMQFAAQTGLRVSAQ